VGKLRGHASKEVADAAKEIVKKWKMAVDKAKQTNGVSNTPKPQNGKPGTWLAQIAHLFAHHAVSADRKASMSAASTPATPTATVGKQDTRTAKSDAIKGGTSDPTRDKCIELIYDALASDSSARKLLTVGLDIPSHSLIPLAVELILSRARGVEKCVFNDNGGTTATYKQKIRSLFVNLKDKNNPGLRETVVSGDLPVEKLTKMTNAVRKILSVTHTTLTCCRKWRPKNARRPIAELRRKTSSRRSPLQSSRRKQTPSNAHDASSGSAVIVKHKHAVLMNL
jgi:transcription elongation factor S-II